MIGIVAKAHQVPIIEEFFELFKTPWELYQPSRSYSAVIVTADEIPSTTAPVQILYGCATTGTDLTLGLSVSASRRGSVIDVDGAAQPIYGNVAALAGPAHAIPCVTQGQEAIGLRFNVDGRTVIRVGYDLFDEVGRLLSEGQPVEHAGNPTLDVHIRMLREWIVDAGVPLMEIPPQPAGHGYAVCLTHDIDFIGIRQHRFDHSMWGFLYRSTVGSLLGLLRGTISIQRAFKMWRAALSLPFVYLGLMRDFWEPFSWYLQVERNLPATYFLIPFKGRAGERVGVRNGSRRATVYDVDDLRTWATTLLEAGCELGVHGIDAWHSVENGREELRRLAAVSGASRMGVRMHWLLQDAQTARVLEEAGYTYDSTRGYNETIGFRNGTAQVFRPVDALTLLELPLHIQDGALFFPERLGLSEIEALRRCDELIETVHRSGGVVTVLWHDRSHGPERFWGDFYVTLIEKLRVSGAWFGTAAQMVGWFGARRKVQFDRVATAHGDGIRVRLDEAQIEPSLTVRIHSTAGNGSTTIDYEWNGVSSLDFDSLLKPVTPMSGATRPRVFPQPLLSSSLS